MEHTPFSAPARGPSAQSLSDEQYRLIVQSIRDYAVFMLSPEGLILSWNEGARLIKGYTAPEVLGRSFEIFYPADAVADGFPKRELKEAARVGRFEDEGWRIRKDGSRFWANVVLSIASGIIEAHGGKIWAESELGVGTTVTFALPVTPPASH
jgi:PAS domain S-box-containing protein